MFELTSIVARRVVKKYGRRLERYISDSDDSVHEAYSPDRVNRRVVLAELVNKVYDAARNLELEPKTGSTMWEHKGYVKVPLTEFIDDKKLHASDVVCVFRKTLHSKTCSGSTDTSRDDIVVALRGTMLDHPQDLMDDLMHAFNMLQFCKRTELVRNVVKNAIAKYGVDSVCITGHSLGAGVALLVAREFAEKMIRLETHLFNPPFLPLEKVMEKLEMLRSSSLTFFHDWLEEDSRASQENIEKWRSHDCKEMPAELLGADVETVLEKFQVLSEWRPHLYLNRWDLICNGYIEYFESDMQTFEVDGGLNMSESKAPCFKKLVKLDSSAQHLIPSANLFISDKGLLTLVSHKLEHWADDMLDVEHMPFMEYELQDF